MLEGPFILKMEPQEMAEAETTPILEEGPGVRRNTQAFREQLAKFYVDEGVVATFDRGSDMAAGRSDLSWQQRPAIVVGRRRRAGSPDSEGSNGAKALGACETTDVEHRARRGRREKSVNSSPRALRFLRWT